MVSRRRPAAQPPGSGAAARRAGGRIRLCVTATCDFLVILPAASLSRLVIEGRVSAVRPQVGHAPRCGSATSESTTFVRRHVLVVRICTFVAAIVAAACTAPNDTPVAGEPSPTSQDGAAGLESDSGGALSRQQDAAAPASDAPFASDLVPPPPNAAPPMLMNGHPCISGTSCLGGLCIDGLCCERVCGTCETCAGASTGGTCTAVLNGVDMDSCSGDSLCLGANRCGAIDQRQEMSIGTDGGSDPHGLHQAQGVTVGRSGALVAVRLRVGCQPAARFTVEIRTDTDLKPGNPILASQNVLGADVPVKLEDWRLFTFTNPAQVYAGQRIQIVVHDSPEGVCWIEVGSNVYAAGHLSDFQNGVWVSLDNLDLTFQTFVE
jgi:hypothetical protein